MCIRDSTYTIEVFNQGTIPASGISLVDYTPSALAVNDPDWVVGSDGNATIDLVSVTLAPGESATVDITMTILAAGDIDNSAEITNSTAVDGNGDPILDADGNPLADVDSIADAVDADVLSDGVLNGDDGDEDDHDIASITVASPPPPVLAFTGRGSLISGMVGLLIILLGAAFMIVGRREEDEAIVN